MAPFRQHLFDVSGQPVAEVEIPLADGGRCPTLVTFEGKTYVMQLGRYVEAGDAVAAQAVARA